MGDAKIDMALDDIIKKNRAGNRRGRGGRGGGGGRGTNSLNSGIQRRGASGQRGNRGRVGKAGGRGARRGGRNSFNQQNNNRFNNVRQQRGGNNNFRGLNRASARRNFRGDNPTATYNPLSRDMPAPPKQQQQQQQRKSNMPRQQQGINSAFNKIRINKGPQHVTALRRRMVAAQRALSRATKTLASMPRLKIQRQKFLQHPQQLSNLIKRNKGVGGGIQKRLSTGRKGVRGKAIGRGGGRRTFV